MKLNLSLVSALDTLYLMDLKEDFWIASQSLKTNFLLEKDLNVSLFETNIRVVGGLLGAYELSKESFLLDIAKSVAEKLIRAFDPTNNLPYIYNHHPLLNYSQVAIH
jgi:mannosyl-oligosaccharide alpha-1,2-mannosidase